MPTEKVCPKCGSLCQYRELVPNFVFGYKCENCGCKFSVITIMWSDNYLSIGTEHEDAGDRI